MNPNKFTTSKTDDLTALVSLMQQAVDDFHPSEFSSYALKWKQAFWEQYDCANVLYVKTLMEIGAQFIDFNNCDLAEYYLSEAKLHAANLYGANSFLENYIQRFYAMICYLQGEYTQCMEYAETALLAIHNMYAAIVPREFYDIYENKDLHFDSIFVLLFNSKNKLADIAGEESPSIETFICEMLKPSGLSDKAISSYMDSLGVPSNLYSVVKERLFQSMSPKSLGMHKTMQLVKVCGTLWSIQKSWEGKNTENISNEVRDKAVSKYADAYTSLAEILGETSLIGQLFKASIDNLMFWFLLGYIKIGCPQKTIAYYELNQDVPMNAKGALIALIYKCIAYDQLNEYKNVQKCLEIILESYRNIVSQMLLTFDEAKQIEFLSIFQAPLYFCLYLLAKHRGIEYAYSFCLSYKMLAYDYSRISKQYLKDRHKQREDLLQEISNTDIYNDLFSINLNDVYGAINSDCILIEFMQIFHDIDNAAYVAFILDSSGIINFIELALSDLVDGQLAIFLASIAEKSTDINIYLTDSYQYILQNIVLPLTERIPVEKHNILIAPTGKLFGLPFELFFKDGYNITYIDSGRELAKHSNRTASHRKSYDSIAIGAPDIDGFPVLHTSPYEVATVSKLLQCTPVMHPDKSVFDRAYQYMHISMHGDYMESADILSSSYLILSNTERISAKELSLKDYSGTELVTLAACKSGRGIETDIEGALGIRRSFINAGAKNVIASLWDVSDFASTILLIRFYENLAKQNLGIGDALREAKCYLRNLTALELRGIFSTMSDCLGAATVDRLIAWAEDSMPDNKLLSEPYYWAAFILVTS